MLPERSTSRIYRYAHRWRSQSLCRNNINVVGERCDIRVVASIPNSAILRTLQILAITSAITCYDREL